MPTSEKPKTEEKSAKKETKECVIKIRMMNVHDILQSGAS
jgi:hypothetical protein